MFFEEEFETLPREALEALQLKRLVATAKRVYARVPFYKKTCGITILSAFSPFPWNRWCGSTPLPGPPENPRW